jgi:hypothetical protein
MPHERSILAAFYGLDWIATVPPTVKLAAERFGWSGNLVFGWVLAGRQMGAAFAPRGAGFSRTAYESYLPAFFIAGAVPDRRARRRHHPRSTAARARASRSLILLSTLRDT